MRRKPFTRGLLVAPVALALIAFLAWSDAAAQSTSASVRGTVTDPNGPVGGVRIVAVNATTGFQYQTQSRADGTFNLAGLPPATYDIKVTGPSHAEQTKTVQILIGQTATLDFRLSPQAMLTENVSVVGERVVETRTSEIGTVVTTEQLDSLPQNNRNFLNFAILAPGVRVTDDPNNKQFRALGQPANATNVFIDGVSYKNEVLEGGVVGQDASRGNPFPQNAVQEFQVLTQNYKAEYERASTGVITAVTKTGGNIWSGDVFGFYQNKNMVSKDYYDARNGATKPEYKRYQYGASVGGPIVKDKLTLFVSYENNTQDRANRVTLGSNVPSGFDTEPFQQYEGNFTSPFRSDLLFGKLSWQPALDQTLDFSVHLRDESDKRSFGGQTSYSSGEDVQINTDTFALKHRWIHSTWLNEASVQWQSFQWNPKDISQDPQQNYWGFITIGARNGTQDFKQDRLSLRDDFTFFLSGAGSHALKAGVVWTSADYDVTKLFGAAGSFNYENNPSLGRDFDSPFEAYLNYGDPQLTTSNDQYGLYFQDDWTVTPRFTLNLGIRWDYETDMMNNSFVTPAGFVDALTAEGVLPNTFWSSLTPAEQQNYFSTGSSREAFTGAIQPRIGFSYDLTGSGKTVLFGGAGRYYDRDIYNVFFDEKFREQWRSYRFCFYANELQQDNCGDLGIAWDPAYLERGALQELLESSSGPLGKAEIFLIPNDLKMPYNDQASLGFRHNFGTILGEVAISYIRGKNGFSYQWGNRDLTTLNNKDIGDEYSNLLIGTDDKEYWYKGAYFKLEKPLTSDAKWGFTATYTLGYAEQRGNDAFSLDFITVKDYPKAPTPDDERHRVVVTGIFRVPWDVLLSTNVILGSGLPYDINDFSAGWSNTEVVRSPRGGRPPADDSFIAGWHWQYRQVDLRAEKTFRIGKSQALGVIVEGFNVLGYNNFSCYDGFIPPAPGTNPNFGKPSCIIGPTRSYQAGLRYSF